MLGMDSRQQGWVTAVALLISVFMAGALTAVAVVSFTESDRDSERDEWRRDGRRGPPGRPGGPGGRFDGQRGDFMLDMLTERLDLNEAQQEQVREIMARREAVAREVMESVRDRLKGVMDSVDAEIRTVLTPEQQEEFEEIEDEARETLGRRFPDGPPGGPPSDHPPGRRR